MQQFIEKEIEFSDRPEVLSSQKNMVDPSENQPVEPCKIADLFRFADTTDRILMILGSIFSITNGFSMIFYARPLKDLINAYKPNYNFQELVANIAHAAQGFLLNGILVFISCALMNISWTIASQRQLIKIRKLYYKSLLEQELRWFDQNKPEQICSDMYLQTQRAQNAFVESVTSMLTCLSMSVGSIIVSFILGWRLAMVLNLYLPVVVILNYVRSRYNIKAKNATADLSVKLNGSVFQVFENIKTVKYLGGEDYELEKFSQSLGTYKEVSISLQKKMAVIWGITAFFTYASVFALGFWYGCKLVIEEVYNENSGKNYDVGDVVSIFFCMYICGVNFNPLSGHLANLNGCRVALSKIMRIIDRKPKKSEGFQPCIEKIDQIEFKNMTFFFNKPLFTNFSLTIKRGVTALVGTSGNGKSTLLNLLVKFYQPFTGTIILSNDNSEQALKDIQEKSLRERIGYVGQEPVLLGRTAREVLLAEQIEEKRIWQILEICCIADLVKELGLDAPFKCVSGGQKQRLAIARAVLRNPEILILDEGTSALDSINQRTVLQNLKLKSRIPFVIMIAHRIETLVYADQIYKIFKGQAQLVKQSDISSVINNIEVAEGKISQCVEQVDAEVGDRLSEKHPEYSENDQGSKDEESTKFRWKYFFKLLQINKKYKLRYIVGIISAILLGSIFPSFSVILATLVNLGVHVQVSVDPVEKQQLTTKSHVISFMLLVLAIANLIMIIVKEFSFLELGENLGVVLKKAAFKTAINMEMTEIDKRGRPSLVHLINTSAQSTKQLASQTISSFVDVAATLIIGITIACVYCWQITLVALLLIPLTVVAGMLQNKFLTTLSENSDKVLKSTHEMVLESIVNNKTLASLNLQRKYELVYDQKQDDGMKVTYRNSIFSGLTMALSQCLIAFVICLIYYIAAVIAENFNVRFEDIFIAVYAVMFSGVQAGTNIDFIGGISSGLLRTAQYFSVVKENESQLDYSYSRRKSNPYIQLQEELQAHDGSAEENRFVFHGCVEFKNVYFRYPNRREYLFEGLSFMVKPGERVAVVGQSGTGKTTIADLLFGIYSPEQGQILIDKVSTAYYKKKHERPRFAIVSQEPALFNRSVIDNVKYNLNCTFNEVEEAARMSDAFGFVEEGNFGKEEKKHQQERETMVQNGNWNRLAGSKGSLFSGGQKQRIAIARALVRKPVVLVMDEATSALDKETEEKVLKNIESLNCSQIIIAHRMSTIKCCDRIVVIKNGKLAEMGSFQELMELGGQFARLVAGRNDK